MNDQSIQSGTGGHQSPHQRYVLFQRSTTDKLSRPFLPHQLAVISKEAIIMKTKRFLIRICLLVAVLLALPVVVQAQFTYITNNGTITITGYTGSGGVVVIPSATNGYPVTSIGDSAFIYSSLTSVTIPNSVTSIGSSAFFACSSLTNAPISSSVTNIGEAAFAYTAQIAITVNTQNQFYSSTNGVLFNKDQTTLVQYPAAKVGTSYTISNSVTAIGGSAFYDCYSLSSVTIPDTVTNIADYAFGNTALTNITIPNTVINIGDYAFVRCPGLTNVTIPNSVTSIQAGTFVGCTGLTNVAIGDSVASIGADAFSDCTSLINVMIPDSVTNIGDQAFLSCSSLTATTVNAQNSFYSSVDGVLFDKRQTTLVQYPEAMPGAYVIPGSVTNIGDFAFAYCSLTSVTIPGSVTIIGDDSFGSSSLTSVYFGGNAPDFSYGGPFNNEYYNLTVYYLPGPEGWGPTFAGVPAVRWLPGCLQVVIAPVNASYAGAQWQVDGGPSENSGVIVSNLATGNHTVSFTTVNGWTTPASQTISIITNFFAVACGTYAQIPFIYTTNNGMITITGYAGSGGAVTIPDSINGLTVASIGTNAFYGTSLTSVTIPSSITNIEYGAFEYCTSLTNLFFEGNAPNVGSYVFYSDSATVYYLPRTTGWGTTLGGIRTDELTALMVATDLLPSGTSGEAYSQQLTAWGGQPAYTWTLTAGALPEGLTLGTNGVVSGTPTIDGALIFTVKVTDATNSTATQALSLNIGVSPLQIITGSLPNGTNGVSYSQQLSAAFGHPPYSWSLISGSLPPGLTLSPDGLISGSPAFIGTVSFTVEVTDALSITATETFTFSVILNILHSFAGGSDGAYPQAALISSGNTLYGTTEGGGSSGDGTIFKVNTDGTGYTNLYSFAATTLVTGYIGFTPYSYYANSDGANPVAGLVLSGNTLYGTAKNGGSLGSGTVFAINTDGTDFTNLHNFTDSDGDSPRAAMIISGNKLYGTAYFGGGGSLYGTVFAINTDGSGFTNLYNFTGGSDGAYPWAGLVLSGNTLYGTTWDGGSFGNGTVFAIGTDGTDFTNLYTFTATDGGNSTNDDGSNPQGGLALLGNTLYGTAYFGGAGGWGTVFAVCTNGTGFTNLHTFSYNDGSHPTGITLSGDTLYGTTQQGGAGTIFAINTDGSGFTNLYFFTGGNDGEYPFADVILSDGALYGTAEGGGTNNAGTVFGLSLGPISALPFILSVPQIIGSNFTFLLSGSSR